MLTDDLTRAVIDASYDVTTLVDQLGVVRWVSGGVERLTGYRGEALVGRPMIDLVHSGDRDRARLAFARLVGDVNMSRLVIGIDHADGSNVLVEVTGVNRTDDERVNGYVMHLRRALGAILTPDESGDRKSVV